MRIAVIILGALLASFGGGCLYLNAGSNLSPVLVLGWPPLLGGLGLAGYGIAHERGKPFPTAAKMIILLIPIAFIASICILLIGISTLDFK